MKQIESNRVAVDGNMDPIRRRAMGIHEASRAYVFKALVDLYSNKPLAALRETFTNALDSHVRAGQARPVEVKLPTAMLPTLSIRDFGTGLTIDEVEMFFGDLGASDKRETNDEIGMLGFGCKAPLTYTSQFAVVAIKDGVKATVLCVRGSDHIGEIQTMAIEPTDEPNGVEVQIPVSHVSEMLTQANNLFRYVDPGVVLVDGKPPKSYRDDERALEVAADLHIVPSQGNQTDIVIMGNIPYPCGQQLSQSILTYSYRVVAKLDIGEVEFTPSREALQYSEHTKVAMEAVRQMLKLGTQNKQQEEVDKQPDKASAAKVAMRWQGVVQNAPKPTFKGMPIPTQLRATGWSYNAGNFYPRASTAFKYLNLNSLIGGENVVVLNAPTSSPDMRFKQMFTDAYPNKRALLISSVHDEDLPWLFGTQVEYAVVRPRKDRDPSDPSKRIKVERNVWMRWEGHKWVENAEPLKADKVCYALRTDPSDPNEVQFSNYTREAWRAMLQSEIEGLEKFPSLPSIDFVIVRRPEIEKFKKEYPNAEHVRPFFAALGAELEKKLTPDQVALRSGLVSLVHLPPAEVNDPWLRGVIERLVACRDKDVLNLHAQIDAIVKICQRVTQKMWDRRTTDSDIRVQIEKFGTEYPLLRGSLLSQKTEALEYINAVFAYRTQQEKEGSNE